MRKSALFALRAIGFGLLPVAQPGAFAQVVQGGGANAPAPPVEHASFHQLIFANDDVAVLNNLCPPGGDSGLHAHYRDLFAVVIQSVPSSGQRAGQPLTAAPALPWGSAV
jgi:hypothetical protein